MQRLCMTIKYHQLHDIDCLHVYQSEQVETFTPL